MTPVKLCAAYFDKLIFLCAFGFCILFFGSFAVYAADFDFHPKITLKGFDVSAANSRSTKYAQGELVLPLSLYLGSNFSAGAEYFFTYDYFDKQKDTYNKLNRAFLAYSNSKLTLTAGRNFLDLGLNPIIYFGYYENRDLKKPTYFDGAFATYEFNNFFELSALGGTFENKDLYGAIFKMAFLKGFYFLAKEKNIDLSVYGASFEIENDTFALKLLGAYNGGKTIIEHFGTIVQKHKGKSFSGDISFKKEREFFGSEVSFGAQYLSPDKENSLGYMAPAGNFDRGFIFNNLTDRLETLTYKLAFAVKPNFIDGLNAKAKIYNFRATDKRLIKRDIASELDLSVSYQYKNAVIELLYGYLRPLDAFNDFTGGLGDRESLNKFGLIFSYQF